MLLVNHTLTGLAIAAANAGQVEAVPRFLGAAEAVRSAAGSPPSRMLQGGYERARESSRRALGPIPFAEAWKAGAAWSTEGAFTVAMSEQIAVSAAPRVSSPYRLSPRELDVLQLIAEGLSTREMADRLCVSENTVKTHCSRIFDKLGVNRRTQAVQAGKRLGLLP